ncbi:MAG: Gfo/Idh/MocA family oxidoreductase [Geobacteraceae bacterium]|nr:Gfo/Idh/MocA family oxidoreductase [Geobacteraceae bacterium]
MKSHIDPSSVRIGLLGYSDIATRKFIPAIQKCKNSCLKAISTRNPEITRSKSPETPVLSHEELLASPLIDLVYLSLPNHLHEEWAIKALEAGKHLICEKPLSTSLASSLKILDAAKSNKRLIYENQMFLFHPQHALVKAMINSGKIGRVRELRSVFGFPMPAEGNFRLDPDQGGGSFHDLARYPLGIAVYLLNSIQEEFHGCSTCKSGINTSVNGVTVTANSELFSFSISFGQQYEAFYEIVGETGKIRVERAYTTPAERENRIFLTVGSKTSETVVPAVDHFQLMIEEISNIILTDSDFTHLNRQAEIIARLADQMEKGCMENRYEL